MKLNYKRILLIAGILLSLALVFGEMFSPPGELISVDISSWGVCYQTAQWNNEILLLNNDGVRAVNTSGRTVWTISQSSSRPLMHVTENYILIADLNGKNFSVYKGQNLIYTVKTESPVVTAKVASNGSSAAVTEETGYKGRVSIYNSNGGETYKWYSGEGHILAVAYDAKTLAISQLLSNDALASNVILLDPSGNRTLGTVTRTDSVISVLKFTTRGRLLALSDTELLSIEKNGNIKFTVDFAGRPLTAFNIDNDNNLCLALTDVQNNIRLEMYNKDGNKRGEYRGTGEINSLTSAADYVLTDENRDVLKITPRGHRIEVCSLPHDIKNITLWKNRKYAWIMGSSSANIVRIK